MKERGKEKKTKEETKGKRACMKDPSWLSVLHGPRAIQGKKRCAPLPKTLLHFLHGVQTAPHSAGAAGRCHSAPRTGRLWHSVHVSNSNPNQQIGTRFLRMIRGILERDLE